MRKYVIVCPVRNEAQHLERLIACIIAQSSPPSECLFVDDGSTDKTASIIQTFAAQVPWIRLVQLPNRGFRYRGAGVVRAVKYGLEHLCCQDADFFVKLDADLSFEPLYFRDILARFETNPKLGIACGALYVFRNGRWVIDKAPKNRTWGPTKVYRRECLKQIGGLVEHIGWDAIDDFKAQMLGWETRTFHELVVLHHRPTGRASGVFSGAVEHGLGNYFLGSHPLFAIARGIYRMLFDRPILLQGLGILWGYFQAFVKRYPRVDDPELIRFVRRYELRRLVTFYNTLLDRH